MSVFESEQFQQFKASLSTNANVYFPSDAYYQTARATWNHSYTAQPSVIIWCAAAEDVSAAVKFLVANKQDFTVAGGRHSRFCVKQDAAQINLGGLNRVRVDAEKKLVYAQGGTRNGELDAECSKYALATPAGTNPDTGIGGLILGGGYGFLTPTHGLSIDNLVDVELVDAEGRIIHANETENSDLFWGVRGAGFNFGIITEFTLRLHPVGHIERPLTASDEEIIAKYSLPDQSALVNKTFSGMLIYPWPLVPGVLKELNDFAFSENGPKDVVMGGVITQGPHGPCMAKVLSYYGTDIYQGVKAVAPFRGEGSEVKPVMDMVQPITYVELQKLFEPKQEPNFYHERAVMIQEFSPEIIDIVTKHYLKVPAGAEESAIITLTFKVGHGASIDPSSTAFSLDSRKSRFWIAAILKYKEEARETGIAWLSELKESLRPFATGYYINNVDADDKITDLFPVKEHLMRLRTLKTKFDPSNVFHNNNNVLPL